MKKTNKNKFEINSKSISLTKLNPYYENKDHYLPYRYSDPSFKLKYNGPLMQKDLYLLNLMNNHFNASSSKKYDYKPNLPLIQSTQIDISKKKDIVFEPLEYYKTKNSEIKTNYAFSLLKKKFFYVNPVLLKKQLIDYRKNRFKGINVSQDKAKYNPNKYGLNFQKQVIENNYKNWEKIKEKHLKKELEGYNDKYHDDNKIYEILKIKNPNKYNYTEARLNSNIKHKSINLSIRKSIESNFFRPNKRKYTQTNY